MRVLGIESSCDETGVAIYDSNKGLIAQALYSQIKLHQQYGGVVPELASRDHIKWLIPLVDEALNKANLKNCASKTIPLRRGKLFTLSFFRRIKNNLIPPCIFSFI